MGGGRFSSGMRTGFARGPSRAFNRGFSGNTHLRNSFHAGFHNHGRDRFHSHGFRNNCFGFGCGAFNYGYPWWGAYYDPWAWNWDYDDARFDADYNNNLAQANEMNEQSLEQQRMLRQEEADGDQDAYARSEARHPTPDSSSETSQGAQIVPPTVLVFRDHHQQEVQNYAIVGQTLWNLASPHTQKIPLSELDIPATEKANDDRGLTFQMPGMQQGQ